MEPLEVLTDDGWILAIHKPAGLSMHGGGGEKGPTVETLLDAMLAKRPLRNDFRPVPAHRLDRETSGVVLVALRRPALRALSEAFETRAVAKTYLTICRGTAPDLLVLDAPLAKLEGTGVQDSKTEAKSLEHFPGATFLECHPLTGRKHQIRRHLADAGFPVAGDATYGDRTFNESLQKLGLSRMFLHAARIAFPHPRDGAPTTITAPLPPDLTLVLAGLRARAADRLRSHPKELLP